MAQDFFIIQLVNADSKPLKAHYSEHQNLFFCRGEQMNRGIGNKGG